MEIASVPFGSCSKDDKKIYQEWFNLADSGTFLLSSFIVNLVLCIKLLKYLLLLFFQDGDARISGNDATKFFAMSNLSRLELKLVSHSSLSFFIFWILLVYIYIGLYIYFILFLGGPVNIYCFCIQNSNSIIVSDGFARTNVAMELFLYSP